jgi:hypothetical protein
LSGLDSIEGATVAAPAPDAFDAPLDPEAGAVAVCAGDELEWLDTA